MAVPTGIRRDAHISLLDSERIVKRSIDKEVQPQHLNKQVEEEIKETNAKAEKLKDFLEERAENVPEEIDVTFEVAEESTLNEDMDTAASGVVFRPLFVYRYQQIRRGRRTRSVYLPKANEPKLSRTKRSTTSNTSDSEDDIMDTAESSIVFRPLFRYRQRTIQRRRRQ